MFWHLFKYRFKTFLRSKQEVFWSALFPIILCTCFVIAFSKVDDKAHIFHTIPIAVVYENDNPNFKMILNSLAQDDSAGEALFKITETDMNKATALLKNNKIDAAIIVNDSISMMVDEEDINQTAVSTFLNQYLQREALIKQLTAENNPDLQKVIESMSKASVSAITEKSFVDKKIDSMSVYYFALIGMAALFGGFLGMKCVRQFTASAEPEGMRKSIAPVHRGMLIFAEFLAAYVLQLIFMLILLLYMIFAMRIDFGNQAGYVALTCAIGSLVGVASGIFIASIPRLSENMQVTIFLVYSLGCSFLSGLMVGDIKIALQHSAPIVNKINPATLINDSLYSLLLYKTHDRYFGNMAILAGIAVILCVASYFMTRRKSYANL